MTSCDKDLPVDERPSIKNLQKSERVVTWFLDFYYKYIGRRDIKVDPFDSVVLKAHYSFTSHLLLAVFVLVTSHWFIEEPIICIDKSDKSKAPDDLLDICASYPYIEYPFNNDRNNMVRRYALHYRWVHIACLVLSFIFKGVIIFQRIFCYKKHQMMLEEIYKAKLHDRFWIAKRYFSNHIGCHRRMYFYFLVVHICSLFVNVMVFTGLNITFQNQYWDLPKNLLVIRDPTTFHDPYSLIFPPFTKCEITPVHHILVMREKYFGCHLPLMEFYEKFFMIFWFWQVFLAMWTAIYILYHTPFPFCRVWKQYLLINSSFNYYDPYKACSKNFRTDDIFALSCITTLILGDEFDRLLCFLLGLKNVSYDTSDPNETIYYDQDQSEGKFTDTSTFFHSCFSGDKNKSCAPIGFEGLISRTIAKSENRVSEPLMFSTPDSKMSDNSYSLWKRSVSLEFGIAAKNTNSLNFNSKVTPLIQFLNRDCQLMKNSSVCVNVAPSDTTNESNKATYTNAATLNGGEKSYQGVEFNDNEDRPRDGNRGYTSEVCWDEICEEGLAQNFKVYSSDKEENWDNESEINYNRESSNENDERNLVTLCTYKDKYENEPNTEDDCWDTDFDEENCNYKWQ